MKKFFLILSLPLLASSCENEEGQVDSLGPSDVQVSLRANLNNYSSEITNFSKASFEENTTVSVLADVETGAHFDLNTFTALADGTLKYSGEGALYYPQGRIVRFISLYPSPEDWTSWNPETQSLSELDFDVTVKSDQSQGPDLGCDVLYAYAQGSNIKPEVNLEYSHICAQVSVAFKPGENTTVDELDGCYAIIKNISTGANFTLGSGQMQISESSEVKDIKLSPDCVSSDFSKYASAILPPQSVESGAVMLTAIIGDKYINMEADGDVYFEAGTNTILNIEVNKDEAQEFYVVINSNVEDWETNPATSLEISFDEEEESE